MVAERPQQYFKVVNGRCREYAGMLPLGEVGNPWSDELENNVKYWCDGKAFCVGYMRYLGTDENSCQAWCGRPQICDQVDMVADEQWASYIRVDRVSQLRQVDAPPEDDYHPRGDTHEPGAVENNDPEEVRCPWPYEGVAHIYSDANVADMVDSEDPENQDRCRVFHQQIGRSLPESVRTGRPFFHGVLSEDVRVVDHFATDITREPWLYSFDGNEYCGGTLEGGGRGFVSKTKYLSIYFESEDSSCDGREAGEWTPLTAEEVLPGNVFVDDGTFETRENAFGPYHFSVLCGSFHLNETGFVPQALVDAIGYATHPLIPDAMQQYLHRSFFHFPESTQPYTRINPQILEVFLENFYTDADKNEAMYFKQTFLFLLQELLGYRYRAPAAERRALAACALCQDRARRNKHQELLSKSTPARGLGDEGVTYAVCVMTRRSGHVLRAAIRETWGSVIVQAPHTALRFFVGRGEDTVEDFESDDLVLLPAPEHYSAVTLKAFSMLSWAHRQFPLLRFLIRVDDDVYLRPQPLLAQLEFRAPSSYFWGNFDHGSNPVRDENHSHYNSYEQFPKRKHPMFGDIFPPYARGHLWVMSSDLLSRVVEVWKNELKRYKQDVQPPVDLNKELPLELSKRLPHPDDPAIGVAIWSLVQVDNVSVTLDDRDLNVFALNPSCDAKYLNVHNRVWAVHHVTTDALQCMWRVDLEANLPSKAFDGRSLPEELPSLCECSLPVVEDNNEQPDEPPFDYPRSRFNE